MSSKKPPTDLAGRCTPAHLFARVPERSTAAVVITWEQIEARKQRLDELARGLMKEAAILDQHDDSLLRVEREAYIKAIRDALASVETARVVLAHATQRVAREGRQG